MWLKHVGVLRVTAGWLYPKPESVESMRAS